MTDRAHLLAAAEHCTAAVRELDAALESLCKVNGTGMVRQFIAESRSGAVGVAAGLRERAARTEASV